MTVRRTGELISTGLTAHELALAQGRGERLSVRHGAWSDAAPRDDLDRHRQLAAGTWPLLGENAVLSHATAAVLHGLPVWRPLLERISLTRPDGGHGERTRYLHVRRTPLAPIEVTQVDGYRVTSLERTAVDLARLVSYERAVAVLDAALHAKADLALMDEIVRAATGRAGSAVARRALAFADGRAESVGESISRVRMDEVGLPRPELQFNVYDHNGIWIARTDFAWLEYGVVGEFDGAIKYTGTPEEVAAAVMKEKNREADIGRVGWGMARWGWDVLGNRAEFRGLIASELARGSRVRHA